MAKRDELDLNSLMDHCKANLSSYKIPEATHFVLCGGADVQRIDRSGAGRNATKDDPFRLRCRGRRMYEDRRICGARFGYSLASRQEVEDVGESASSFKTYRGRPPQLAASFISNVACWRL